MTVPESVPAWAEAERKRRRRRSGEWRVASGEKEEKSRFLAALGMTDRKRRTARFGRGALQKQVTQDPDAKAACGDPEKPEKKARV